MWNLVAEVSYHGGARHTLQEVSTEEDKEESTGPRTISHTQEAPMELYWTHTAVEQEEEALFIL
jgi:hypothetical protein